MGIGKLNEIDQAIKAQLCIIRCRHEDLKNPERVMREVNRLAERVAHDKAEIARMLHELQHAQEDIDRAHDRLEELKVERRKHLFGGKIDRLEVLRAQVAALEAELKGVPAGEQAMAAIREEIEAQMAAEEEKEEEVTPYAAE